MVTCHGLVDGWCLSGATSGKEDRMGAPGGNRQGRDSEAHSDLPGTAGRPGPMTAAQRPQAAGTTQETEGTQGPACRVDGAARAAAGRYRILGGRVLAWTQRAWSLTPPPGWHTWHARGRTPSRSWTWKR